MDTIESELEVLLPRMQWTRRGFVMTSLVTGLGLLPLAVGMNAAGREIEGPMALVILGGLFTSTALNLLILPPLALRYGRFEPVGAESEAATPREAAAE